MRTCTSSPSCKEWSFVIMRLPMTTIPPRSPVLLVCHRDIRFPLVCHRIRFTAGINEVNPFHRSRPNGDLFTVNYLLCATSSVTRQGADSRTTLRDEYDHDVPHPNGVEVDAGDGVALENERIEARERRALHVPEIISVAIGLGEHDAPRVALEHELPPSVLAERPASG
jgi:hypothetical protein